MPFLPSLLAKTIGSPREHRTGFPPSERKMAKSHHRRRYGLRATVVPFLENPICHISLLLWYLWARDAISAWNLSSSSHMLIRFLSSSFISLLLRDSLIPWLLCLQPAPHIGTLGASRRVSIPLLVLPGCNLLLPISFQQTDPIDKVPSAGWASSSRQPCCQLDLWSLLIGGMYLFNCFEFKNSLPLELYQRLDGWVTSG